MERDFDEAVRCQHPAGDLHRGEPTLRADLVELVDAAQWFVTRLNTNGRLLTPMLCQKLYDASLDSVQVTLYSRDPATHNALVGRRALATPWRASVPLWRRGCPYP